MKPNATRAVERCEHLVALGPPPPQSRPWKLKRWLRDYRAIMALDITEVGEMLREVYAVDRVEEMARRAHITAGLARFAEPGAGSVDFLTAPIAGTLTFDTGHGLFGAVKVVKP